MPTQWAIRATSVMRCSNGGTFLRRQIGDGVWDRDAYFRVNYGWTTPRSAAWQTSCASSIAANADALPGLPVGNCQRATIGDGSPQWHSTRRSGRHASQRLSRSSDRGHGSGHHARRTSRRPAADCRRGRQLRCARGQGARHRRLPVLKWIDVFLVEPRSIAARPTDATEATSMSRSSAKRRSAAGGDCRPGGAARRAVPDQMSAASRSLRDQRGAAAAEMALVMPLLLAIDVRLGRARQLFLQRAYPGEGGARRRALRRAAEFHQLSTLLAARPLRRPSYADTKAIWSRPALLSGGTDRLRRLGPARATITRDDDRARRPRAANTHDRGIYRGRDRRGADRHGHRHCAYAPVIGALRLLRRRLVP